MPDPSASTDYPCPDRLDAVTATLTGEIVFTAWAPSDVVLGIPRFLLATPELATKTLTDLADAGGAVNCDKGTIQYAYGRDANHLDGVFISETPLLLGWDPEAVYRTWGLNGQEVAHSLKKSESLGEWVRWRQAAVRQLGLGGVGPPMAGGGIGGFVFPRDPVGGVDLGGIGKLLGLSGGSFDLSGVVVALLAILQSTGKLKDVIGDVPAPLADALGQLGDTVGTGITAGQGVLADRLAAAFGLHADATGRSADAISAQSGAGFVAGASQALGPLLKAVVEKYGFGLSSVETLVNTFSEKMLRLYNETVEDNAELLREHPERVTEVAAKLFTRALEAGTAAQLAALGLELIYPTKHIGIDQLVGFIAQFAGFDKIMAPVIAPTLHFGLGLAAQYEAGAKFRTRLPDPIDAEDRAARRFIPLTDYADVLRAHGYRDEWVGTALASVWVHPRPREIITLLEGAEIDAAWVAEKLRRHGWSDDDVKRGVAMAQIKAVAPGRSAYVSAVIGDYAAGKVTDADLKNVLDSAHYAPEHRLLWEATARIRRRSDRMTRIMNAALGQYVDDQVSRGAVKQLLDTLGFTPDEVTIRLVEADLKRGKKLLAEGEAVLTPEIRALRAAALNVLKRELRLRQIKREVFLTKAEALGYDPDYAGVVADLELTHHVSAEDAALPPLGLGAVEQVAQTLAGMVQEQLRLRLVTGAEAELALQKVGLPSDITRELIRLGEALGLAGPDTIGLPGFGVTGLWVRIVTDVLELLGLGFGSDQIFQRLVAKLHLPDDVLRIVEDLVGALARIFTRGRG